MGLSLTKRCTQIEEILVIVLAVQMQSGRSQLRDVGNVGSVAHSV